MISNFRDPSSAFVIVLLSVVTLSFLASSSTATVQQHNHEDAAAIVTRQLDDTSPTSVCELTDINFCVNGDIPGVNLGNGLTAEECRTNCESVIQGDGCWVLVSTGFCFCRSGTVGYSNPDSVGGACLAPPPPTLEPTVLSPPVICEDSADDLVFNLKEKKCNWLSALFEEDASSAEAICLSELDFAPDSVASVVCPVTCDTCADPDCSEDEKGRFLFISDTQKKCKWLEKKVDTQPVKFQLICDVPSLGGAAACPVLCGVCVP